MRQTGGTRRGGWNTSFARRNGRTMSVSVRREEGTVAASSGAGSHQAQDPRRPSKVPDGTDGITGCPEHQEPEQGRRAGGIGSGSDGPARSWSKFPTSDGRRIGSFFDVTRCEHSALATEGASSPVARSVVTAPADDKNRCQSQRDLTIGRVLPDSSPFRSAWGTCRGHEAILDRKRIAI
jgi:hypothetical protein